MTRPIAICLALISFGFGIVFALIITTSTYNLRVEALENWSDALSKVQQQERDKTVDIIKVKAAYYERYSELLINLQAIDKYIKDWNRENPDDQVLPRIESDVKDYRLGL